jgi:hypothetical protein
MPYGRECDLLSSSLIYRVLLQDCHTIGVLPPPDFATSFATAIATYWGAWKVAEIGPKFRLPLMPAELSRILGDGVDQAEPPRVCRRQFRLSHAAIAGRSSTA